MNEQITISRRCPSCPTVQEVTVDKAAYESWLAGEYIQNAFPTLRMNQREILQTGICPKCWDGMRDPDDPPQCNGICLTGADVGVPEYSGVAYAHPDCELHGDPDREEEAPGADPEYDEAAAASEHDALRYEER